MFHWKGLGFLTSVVGVPKKLHPDTEICKSFDEGKVFVEADLSKELQNPIVSSRIKVDSEIEFQYPWLPPRCSSCMRWDHLT